MLKDQIINSMKQIVGDIDIHLEVPVDPSHGDYSTNIAMQIFSNRDSENQQLSDWLADMNRPHEGAKTWFQNPRDIADKIVEYLSKDKSVSQTVSDIKVEGPGFINFFLSQNALEENLRDILDAKDNFGKSEILKGQKIAVEFAHPNTHKELHIGHMRTLMLGESLSRIFESQGAEVFRANYQGDIGPHVAKAIWGTTQILKEKGITWDEAEKLTPSEKAHLLGQGYVKGNQEFESRKEEINSLNISIYNQDPEIVDTYERTRRWSLEYYDIFYSRFYTKFDKLYFESQMAEDALKTVRDNIGKVFMESEGAVIFDGEKHGLHKRVFITKDGYPTYEGKDMALAPKQYADFPFDKMIHVVANEQTEYFKVIFKALSELDPKFRGREEHLPMGMVQLVGMKMSSRTGVLVTVENLLQGVKDKVMEEMQSSRVESADINSVAEEITIAAVKYAFLKVNPESSVSFDINNAVDINGNTGPYIQYTFARTQSVLNKANNPSSISSSPKLSPEELGLLRAFAQYPGVLSDAAKNYSPNDLCNYLHELAQRFNSFYNSHKIIGSDQENYRLKLTEATGQILENGLNLLGIKAPQRM